MNESILTINNIDIYPGESKEINFQISKLPTHTIINLPVFIYRAKLEGPTLLLSAAIHGDELNGLEIIRQLIQTNLIQPIRGTILAIPLINIYGFLHQSRELPDGKDLNRFFPGSEDGSLAARLAFTLVNEILPHIDYGIDFHTGSTNRSNYPQVRCGFDHNKSCELAKAFAPPMIINAKLREKSFRTEAIRLDKPMIVFEGGEAMRFDLHAIQEGINGTLRVMNYFDMTDDSPPANESIWLKSSRWIRANHGGLYHPIVRLGDKVKRNQLLANITDPFGEFTRQVKASTSGYIIGINYNPVVHKGDAIIHLGTAQ